jgi:hypothetical protein
MIQRILRAAAAMLAASTLAAHAGCYVDYKAKKDEPLQLHYGVMEVPGQVCTANRDAAAVIGPRLAKQGWTLLNVVSVFDDTGLAGRKASAGQFYLRY